MNKALIFSIAAVIGAISGGCNKQLFVVDFKQGEDLRYKFVSTRDINVVWEVAEGKNPKGAEKAKMNQQETVEMVIRYSPVEVNPYGLTKIKATCESVKVNRISKKHPGGSGEDAVKTLAGKSFSFTVTPAGNFENAAEINAIVKATGDAAFKKGDSQGRIKEPDMVDDFIVFQWFLWEPIRSIVKPAEGVSIGDTWKSKILIPTPMVMRTARDVEYKLEAVSNTNKGQVAIIKSTCKSAGTLPSGLPVPYTGNMRLSGMFGTMVNYKILALSGQGEDWFNIDKGRIEKSQQQYEIEMSASLIFQLGGVTPKITLKQNLTTELLEN